MDGLLQEEQATMKKSKGVGNCGVFPGNSE